MTFIFDADGRLIEERAIRYNDARGQNEAWIDRSDVDREFRGIRGPAAGEARWGTTPASTRTSAGALPTSSRTSRRGIETLTVQHEQRAAHAPQQTRLRLSTAPDPASNART
jgi:hypothetical protein